MARYWSIFVMMKYIFSMCLIAFASISNGQSRPQATFETKSQVFHDVILGTQLRVVYYFKNTGDADLVLLRVKSTCGCTATEYPTYAIKAGQRDSIVATFDTDKRVGYNAKGINIESNIGPISLVFEAYVIDPNDTAPEEIKEEEEDHTGHNHEAP